MDGTPFSSPGHQMLGGALAASATFAACAAWVASRMRLHRVRLRDRYPMRTKNRDSTGSRPLLDGFYRGRNVQMTEAGEWLIVIVSTENVARMVAEFDHRSLTPLTWLPHHYRRRLSAVADTWSVAVRGKTVLLSCQTVKGPERLRLALDVACDLADVVDLSNFAARR